MKGRLRLSSCCEWFGRSGGLRSSVSLSRGGRLSRLSGRWGGETVWEFALPVFVGWAVLLVAYGFVAFVAGLVRGVRLCRRGRVRDMGRRG